MKLLLDTHAFLWFVWNDPLLSQSARLQIEDGANDLYLSAGNAWELGVKIGTGKLSVGQDLETFLATQLSQNRIALVPISVTHVRLVSELPFHHKDPFDRLLAAQSLVEQMPLISRDEVFDAYGVSRIW